MSKYADGTHKFSPTELATFRACRRSWMLDYHLSLKRKERDVRYPLEIGNLTHGALEIFYINGGIHGEDALEKSKAWLQDQRAEDLAKCAPEHHPTILKAHRDSEACLLSYMHWLDQTGADLNLKILGAEDKLSLVGMYPNAVLNGRIDLLAEDTQNGDIVVIDFKLVSSITDKIRMLNLDQQAKAYALLAREKYGKRVRVAFRLVKINARSSRVKGPQEEEYTIVLNDKQLDVFKVQTAGMMRDIIALSDALSQPDAVHQSLAYPSPSDTCSWKCPFFPVCPMLDDPHSDGEWLLNDAYESKFIVHPPKEEVVTDEI